MERVILGDGLLLRIWHRGDREALSRIVQQSRDAFGDWLPNALRDLADLDVFLEHVEVAYRAGTGFFYAIEEEGELIGQCSLHRPGGGSGEIGYWVRTDRTGRGVATRAVKAVATAGLGAGLRELVIHCDAGNLRSQAVARKAGFVHTATVELDDSLPRTRAQTGREMTWIVRRGVEEEDGSGRAERDGPDLLGRLIAQQAARHAWLEAAVARWQADPDVAAAWLWGSEGRGTADALSDIDIFVAVHDAAVAELARVEARWSDYGDVLWARENAYNAPDHGRYFSVGYSGPLQAVAVDWYWQLVSAARVGTDTRVLVEKVALARADTETFLLFPNVRDKVAYVHPDDPGERLEGLIGWFWFMYGPLAKSAARGQDARVDEQLPMLAAVLELAQAEADSNTQLPPSGDSDVLVRLRQLADAMAALQTHLNAKGMAVPDTAAAYDYLTVAETIRADPSARQALS